ncbi:signal peptide-containing lipoprotein [Bacillus phage Kirov]|uniref:Signal peptide-containing lipoprotein n=1 Tax=Bacillus phage Kirov TaxID=2783539 RepID=A0A7U3NKM7_9CAUD|nr:signal peptide-containing lipoprotein [Bacillus phage Kirov]QOV08377.1 signal peptide-containing lipoprotein [Bacillus phage Kirov]
MLSKISKTLLALLLAGGIVGCSQKAEPVEKPKAEPKVEQVDTKAVEKQRTINYLTAVSNSTTNSGKVAKEIGALFQKASMHPQLIMNPDWKSDVAKEYDKIQADYDSVKSYRDVPSQYANTHTTLLQGYDYFMQSKVKIMEAIDEVNANKLQEGLDLIGKSTEYITKSTDELMSVPVQK